MTRTLIIVFITMQVWSHANYAVACDQLNLEVTGQLPQNAPTLSKKNDASSGLSSIYDVPLNLLGLEGEQARLVFTRTLPRIWRVDIQLSAIESLSFTPTILSRPAATLIEFSKDGKQIGEQRVVIFPKGGSSSKTGISITILLRSFALSKDTASFMQDYFIDSTADCVEPRKIIYVKTKPDNVRDELNPYLPGEELEQ